jgi:hypothetical protein
VLFRPGDLSPATLWANLSFSFMEDSISWSFG